MANATHFYQWFCRVCPKNIAEKELIHHPLDPLPPTTPLMAAKICIKGADRVGQKQ
jgi:hypothetical protein